MANSDSSWAYKSVQLVDPTPTTTMTDSVWSYKSVSLAPASGSGSSSGTVDSVWSYKSVQLKGPGTSDSDWAFQAVTLVPPHAPVAVMTANGLKRIPIQMWDGTKLRPGPSQSGNIPNAVNPTVTPNV